MPNYLLIIDGVVAHVDLLFGLVVLGKRLDLIFLWIDAKEKSCRDLSMMCREKADQQVA